MTDRFALIVDGKEVARFPTREEAELMAVKRKLAEAHFFDYPPSLFTALRPGVTIEEIRRLFSEPAHE